MSAKSKSRSKLSNTEERTQRTRDSFLELSNRVTAGMTRDKAVRVKLQSMQDF